MSEIQHRLPPVHQPVVHHTAPSASKSVSPHDKVPVPVQHQQPQFVPPPPRPQSQNSNHSQNPVHPNAKTTTHVNNGTTTTKTNITSPVCRNCKTQTTPLWRRDETGQVLCNACGLFLKLHGRPRPISLKTDTIKSRNRIKQHPQGTAGNTSGTGNSSKNSSGSNTPELKSRDSAQSSKVPGKKSPKVKKAKSNTDLTPLLPASGSTSATSTPNSLRNTTPSSAFPHPISNTFHHHHHHHHLPPHLTPHNPPQIPGLSGAHHPHHVVQPLHYPSSTPTQFAPGLQRITSPLLLSTTSSISNARESEKLNPVHAAAGALENMSNELGPSATFKSGGSSVNGVSLMNKSKHEIKKENSSSPSIFSTPSSALSAPHYTSNNGLNSASSSTVQPPKLPALGVSSPSFGPQFHLPSQQHSQSSTPAISQIHSPENSHASTAASSASVVPSLPPIQQAAGENKGSLPHFQSGFNTGFGYSNQPNGYNYNGGDNNGGNNNNNGGNNSGNNNSGNNNNNGPGEGSGPSGAPSGNHEITLLKTRISELELVNDLYRTRIMELEAMEQAARLRENSMRKRLDEVLNLNNAQGSPQAAPAAPAQPAPTAVPSSTPLPSTAITPATSIPTSAPVPSSSNSTISAPSSGLPPFQHQMHLQQHHHQAPSQHPLHHHATMLPSIRQVSSSSIPSSGSGITLPSLKREHDEGYEEEPKKPKLG